MNNDMLVVDRIRYQYEKEWFEFSLSVEKGDIVALIGPSGSGKSTLLSLLAGFISPKSGDIKINGKSIDSLPVYERPFSVLFQEYNLFPHLSVRQNIGLGLHPGLKLTKDQWAEINNAALQVGIVELLDKMPDQLSGGQKQRAALSRCFVQNRAIWLLDEPFSALDPVIRSEMLQLVKMLAKKKNATVIMVTHHIPDACKIANKYAFLDDNCILEHGVISELTIHHENPLLSGFLSVD